MCVLRNWSCCDRSVHKPDKLSNRTLSNPFSNSTLHTSGSPGLLLPASQLLTCSTHGPWQLHMCGATDLVLPRTLWPQLLRLEGSLTAGVGGWRSQQPDTLALFFISLYLHTTPVVTHYTHLPLWGCSAHTAGLAVPSQKCTLLPSHVQLCLGSRQACN